jgi:hypothetical protein
MADNRGKMLTVMISSTARDLPDHRQQVMDACLRQGMLPIAMEHLPASDADAVQTSLDMVDRADLYLGVIGFRYGHVPAGHAISITEMEFSRAIKRGIPCLIFLMHEDHPIKAADVEKGKAAVKLDALKKRLTKAHVANYFKSPDDLRAHVINSLSQFRRTPLQVDLLRSQIGPVFYRVAIINASTVLNDNDAEIAVSALQTQVHRDFAPAWGIDAEIAFVPKESRFPEACWWLVLLDNSDAPGALGYRDLTPDGLPRGKIFVKTIREAGASWTVTASHILLELLANPRINLTAFEARGDKAARLYSYEVCNPCEAHEFAYQIDGVSVSDFVFPAWFEGFREPASTRFDYGNHITKPYEILSGGYALVFDTHSTVGWRTMFTPEPADQPAKIRTRPPKKRGANRSNRC